MQPLSPRKRRFYLYGLIVLFFLSFPIVILYASGYRFKGEFGFVQTGGIFLSVPYPNTVISMNGEEVGESGLLRRTFYISDLSPGSYVIQAMREGDFPWSRTLVVESELVTDADVLLISEDPDIVELSFSAGAPTSTKRISKGLYDAYTEAFEEPPATTTPHTVRGALFVEEGNLYLRWLDMGQSPPSSFCIQPISCVLQIPIEDGRQRTATAAFWGGGIIYTTLEGGIYVSEGDVRPTEVVAPLYPVRSATFRIVDDSLIVKDGKKLYEILGL